MSGIKIFNDIDSLRQWRATISDIALVPTMGNLHPGHLELIKLAKKQARHVILTIFVNPLQFGVNEDFASYPRTLAADIEQADKLKVDAIFAPTVGDIYPDNSTTFFKISAGPLSSLYCGQSRPGHFEGVTTVVAKLFNITAANYAVFGKKDFQQLSIIKQMVAALNFNIKIIDADIKREQSGLALSSRNQYLSAAEKKIAPTLYRELKNIQHAILANKLDFQHLTTSATQNLSNLGWDVDYLTVCEQHSLTPAKVQDRDLVILAAAKLGSTRLIDNIDFSIA